MSRAPRTSASTAISAISASGSAHRRRLTLSAVSASTLLTGVLVSGCGGGTAQSDAASGVPTVTLAKAVDTVGFSAVDVAIAKGYFKDAGVNVKTELLQGSSQTNAALQGGSVQFATLSSNAQLLAASHGVKLQAVASLDYGASIQFVVSKDWMTKHGITPQQPLKQRIRGLVGAKDAAISATGTQFLKLLLTESGVPTSSVQNMAYDLLTTTPSYAKRNPKTTKAVATALARAENLMQKDPESVLGLEAKHFPAYSQSDLRQALKYVQWSPDGQFTQAMWNDALAVTKATGQLGGDVDVSEGTLWTNQYIDRAAAAKQ